MKKITLSVGDRLILPEILPETGRKIEIILCKDILSKTEFTASEISEYKLRDQGSGRIDWAVKAARDKEIEITEEEAGLLKECSDRVDKEGKVTRYNIDLLQKIDKI